MSLCRFVAITASPSGGHHVPITHIDILIREISCNQNDFNGKIPHQRFPKYDDEVAP
jgi:hypothetical protein